MEKKKRHPTHTDRPRGGEPRGTAAPEDRKAPGDSGAKRQPKPPATEDFAEGLAGFWCRAKWQLLCLPDRHLPALSEKVGRGTSEIDGPEPRQALFFNRATPAAAATAPTRLPCRVERKTAPWPGAPPKRRANKTRVSEHGISHKTCATTATAFRINWKGNCLERVLAKIQEYRVTMVFNALACPSSIRFCVVCSLSSCCRALFFFCHKEKRRRITFGSRCKGRDEESSTKNEGKRCAKINMQMLLLTCH